MLSTACANQQHKFQPSHQLPKKYIEIPPRKLLLSHNYHNISENATMQSPRLQKHLPSNRNYKDGDDEDNDGDPYATDHFRMYEFKVRRCTRSRSHDWTDCPFAHPGEKARRRDPRRYSYSSTICSDFRIGGGGGACSRGDDCEFAHGVFECWLHPSRYRTEACKDGKNCKRKVCFFAHSSRQLRLLPAAEASPKYKNRINNNHNRNCCLFCHSPTSTLLGNLTSRSPSLSPPLSPVKQQPTSLIGFLRSPRYNNGLSKFGSTDQMMTNYKDALNELIITSLENYNMNLGEALCPSSPMAVGCRKIPWLDVSFNGEYQNQLQQFVVSPTTPSPSGCGELYFGATSKQEFGGIDEIKLMNENGMGGCGPDIDPDIGWVNELLM